MRFLPLLLPTVSFAASLTITPPVIYDCTGSVGKARLEWSGASGPVQVVVGPANAQMTALGGTSGVAETGTWVSDGLEFRLMNRAGGIEAFVVAKVRCGERDVPGNGIVSASYFPLQAGNTWTYRVDSRAGTSDYTTWKVTGLRVIGGRTYAEISTLNGFSFTAGTGSTQPTATPILLLREDSSGAVWRMTGTPESPQETLFVDPNGSQHTAFSNALGSFPDAVTSTRREPLRRDDDVFVRGVGLVRTQTALLTGSSGGFVSGMELVEFQLATGPREFRSLPRISLGIESTRLDVTGRMVTDCFIPCYFAACGQGPVVDPPGTYKPCVRTRIEASSAADVWADLTLLNSRGQVVLQTPQTSLPGGESVRYVQMPLYSEPNKPLPAGTYRLLGRIGEGNSEAASSSITIEIQ